MTDLVLPLHVKSSLQSIEQVSEMTKIENVFEESIKYLIGEVGAEEIKLDAKKLQINLLTFQECIDTLCWIMCQCVKDRVDLNGFKRFLAGKDFLNNENVIAIYQKYYDIVCSSLSFVTDSKERFVSTEWRLQVEVARRALKNIRRPHVLMNIKTSNNTETVEMTPECVVDVTRTLEDALQSIGSTKFRRIQFFVK